MSRAPAGAVLVLALAGLAALLVSSSAVRVLAGRLPTMAPAQTSPSATGHRSRGPDRARPGGRGAAATRTRPVGRYLSADSIVAGLLLGLVVGAAGLLLIGSDLGPALSRSVGVVASSGLPGALPFLLLVAGIGLRSSRRTRRRRSAALARRSVIRAAEVLVAELQAGAPALDALGAASADLPELSEVSAAARLGGDVPSALAALSRRPGLSGARQLGAAWAVSSETGSGLAATIERLVEALRDDDAMHDETEVALATPRSTARLLAVLPLGGLGLGTVVGADPWGFLTRSPAGMVIAGAGVLLAGVGLEWVERLADRAAQTSTGRSPGRRGHPPRGGPAGGSGRAGAASAAPLRADPASASPAPARIDHPDRGLR